MTEDQAEKTVCPILAAAQLIQVAIRVAEPPKVMTCMGALCMMWVEEEPKNVQCTKCGTTPDKMGQCSTAGSGHEWAGEDGGGRCGLAS